MLGFIDFLFAMIVGYTFSFHDYIMFYFAVLVWGPIGLYLFHAHRKGIGKQQKIEVQQTIEEIEEPRTRPIYVEETIPKEGKSEMFEPLPRSELICLSCGYENPSDAEYCIRCGGQLERNQ